MTSPTAIRMSATPLPYSRLVVSSIALFGNFIIKDLVAFFGSKKSLFVSVTFYVTGSLLFIFADGFPMLFAGAFFFGMNDQFVTILFKIIMNELFGDMFTHYLPICYAGFAFSPLFWPNALSFIVNPNNERPNVMYMENGEEVYYFKQDIINNFNLFLKIQAIVHAGLLVSAAICLRSPAKSQDNFAKIVDHVKKGEYQQASLIFHESKIRVDKTYRHSLRQSMKNLPQNTSVLLFSRTLKLANQVAPDQYYNEQLTPKKTSKDYDVELVERNSNSKNSLPNLHKGISGDLVMDSSLKINEEKKSKSHKQLMIFNAEPINQPTTSENQDYDKRMQRVSDYHAEQKAMDSYIRNDLCSILFLLIILAGTIRTTTARYFLSNFKIMGLYYFDDDKLINTLGSIAYAGYILVCFAFGHIFDLLGLKSSYFLMIGSFAIGHFVYSQFLDNLYAYVALSFLQRVRLLVHARIW